MRVTITKFQQEALNKEDLPSFSGTPRLYTPLNVSLSGQLETALSR